MTSVQFTPIASDAAYQHVVVDDQPERSLISLSMRVAGGALADPVGLSGLAHLVEHLMFAGTRRTGRDRYAETIEELGAYTNATTAASWIRFQVMCAPEVMSHVLDVERDRFTSTLEHVDDATVEREKAVLLHERSQRVEAKPYGSDVESILALLWGSDHTAARISVGRPDEIRAIGLADCQEHARRLITRVGTSIAISGRTVQGTGAAVRALHDALPSAPSWPPPIVTTAEAPVGVGGHVGDHVLDDGLPSRALVGIPLPPAEDPMHDTARLACYLLGHGGRARLRRRLIHERGVLDELRLKTLTRIGHPSLGLIEITPAPGLTPEAARDLVLDELRLACDDIVAAEVDQAAAEYTASWLRDDDTTQGRADGLSLALLRSGRPERYAEELQPARHALEQMREGIHLWASPERWGTVIHP